MARLVAIATSLAIAEVGLQLVCLAFPRADRLLSFERTGLVPDPVLEWRGDPREVENDRSGYRNSVRPERADVIVLGDSQAYGTGVKRDESWPRLIESSLRTSVYNMAVPGYGPAHSLIQFDEALSLHPRVVILSLYFGNDFYDAFRLSTLNPRIGNFAPQDLKQAAARMEVQDPFKPKVEMLFRAGDPPPSETGVVRTWLSKHSRLYGLARAAKNFVQQPRQSLQPALPTFATVTKTMSDEQRRFLTPTDRPGWRTVLTPPYRAMAVDDSDVRIRVGVEIVKRVLREIAEQSRSNRVNFLVTLIPTKETVFWPHTDQTSGALSRLVDDEQRLRIELIDELTSHGIAFIDLTDPLRQADVQPYFETSDGHPNPFGHHVIASTITDYLRGHSMW